MRQILLLIVVSLSLNAQSQTTIFNANFENNAGNNSWSDTNIVGSWNRGTDATVFGSGSYKYVVRDTWNGFNNGYPNNANLETISPRINLTGFDRMTLTFRMFLNTEAFYDGATLFASNDDGVTWFKLGRVNDVATNWYNVNVIPGLPANFGAWTGMANPGWVNASIDLPSQGFDNKDNIRFRMRFGSDSVNNLLGFAFDDFIITGSPIQTKSYLNCGNGIAQDLELWLNTSTFTSLADGNRVDQWTNIASMDPGSGVDATWTSAFASGAMRPTYYNNPVNNLNFNPVVTFDGTNAMHGRSGFYSEDLYLVINPTGTITASRPTEDVFLGDDYLDGAQGQDVTGFSINNTSSRYGASSDIIAYNLASNTGYGRAVISPTLRYDRPLILNARINGTRTGIDLFLDGINLGITLDPSLLQEANPDRFKTILNSRFWLGRSEHFGPSFTGDILEIMSFSNVKSDTDRKRLESYLAVKHGITLGLFPLPELGLSHVPGEYYDSNGTALWNTTLDNGFTNNVTGIGRDDCLLLNQKQSKSVDPNTFITVGLGNLYPTNMDNPNTFQSTGDFLMWGSTASTLSALTAPLEVNLGPSLVTTFTNVTERTWKFKEISQTGNDIPVVKISVDTAGLNALPAITGNSAYVMIVADDENFTLNVETVFLTTNGLKQETFYDFDGVKYVKFGVAQEVIASRDIDFDGINDYIKINKELNVSTNYTISAWVKTTGANDNNTVKTIVSKRSNESNGYDFVLIRSNRLRMTHNNTSRITSNTPLNENVWHYVTFTYNNGRGNLYIDGVLDTSAAMVAPIANAAEFTIGSRFINKDNIRNKFKGNLDEIRLFSLALNEAQIRFLMNQELKRSGTKLVGTIIPETISNNQISSLLWDHLDAYFNMNTYIGTHLNDATGKGHRGALINPDAFSIVEQTAPVPYVSMNDGNLESAAAWKNGASLFIPGSSRTIRGAIVPIEWNIAILDHNIDVNTSNTKFLGLFVNANKTLKINNDLGLTVSHYLYMDGKIDLVGESQLVQDTDSDLVATSRGFVERDQQGTSDKFNYNYWSSPVSNPTVTANNNGYTINGVLRDGTLVSNPRILNFTSTSERDGAAGTPTTAATISGRWLFKYGNLASGQYSNWQYVGPDGALNAGEGWTMKGTGATTADQNYIFVGRPNNGNINLTINAGNDYLVGNPYPSAIDAHAFLNDNPQLDGTLYFWEHWGGNSHLLQSYQGGYALYNYSGGVSNATIGTAHPNVNQGGIATKTPGRYIPVAQGFFVTGVSNGSILFRNSQRLFAKESSGNSIFVAAPGSSQAAYNNYNGNQDTRSKFRIGFDSPGTIHRQLLLTIDPNATLAKDFGFDGVQFDEQIDDMSFKIANENFTIQGIDTINDTTVLPLRVKLANPGTITIKLDDLEHVNTNQNIYLKDAEDGSYYDLKTTSYVSPYLWAGVYENRYTIVFALPSTLSNNDVLIQESDLIIFTPTNQQTLHVKKGVDVQIEQLTITNMLGQQVATWDVSGQTGTISVPVDGIATGTYIVSMHTNYGVQTRKVILE